MGQRATVMMNNFNPFANVRNVQEPEEVHVRRPHATPAQNRDANTGSPIGDRFFSTHFLMGGKRFEMTKPDAFLFGNNSDLDLLGAPVKFPYGGVSETVNVLNALVNIRRDSVKLVRDDDGSEKGSHRLEFIYDCDVSCSIQVHFCAREVVDGDSVRFDIRFPELRPTERFQCDVGADQMFSEVVFKSHQFDPHKMYYNGGFWFPVVIEIRAHCAETGFRDQVQVTMCVVERAQNPTTTLILKPLKQKLITDGVVYLLQEVFGIENRETDRDRAFECVVCRDNDSDTLLLPCRHLCICKSCDESFLHNVKECPICRTPVKALLTLDAVQIADDGSDTAKIAQSPIEHLRLTEALNGPISRSSPNTISRSSNMTRRDVMTAIGGASNASDESGDAIELQDIVINRAVEASSN